MQLHRPLIYCTATFSQPNDVELSSTSPAVVVDAGINRRIFSPFYPILNAKTAMMRQYIFTAIIVFRPSCCQCVGYGLDTTRLLQVQLVLLLFSIGFPSDIIKCKNKTTGDQKRRFANTLTSTAFIYLMLSRFLVHLILILN